MKKNLIAFLIVFVSVACWQCGDKGEDDPAPDPKIEITGSPEVNLPAAGGNGVISFTTNVAWSAKVNDTKASSWCSISPESGKAGDVKITVTAKKDYELYDDFSAEVVITAGTASETVTVTRTERCADSDAGFLYGSVCRRNDRRGTSTERRLRSADPRYRSMDHPGRIERPVDRRAASESRSFRQDRRHSVRFRPRQRQKQRSKRENYRKARSEICSHHFRRMGYL